MQPRLLDLSGLKCPVPALRTKRALASMQTGERLEVICTDPLAKIDIPFLVSQTTHKLLASVEKDERLQFMIEVG